MELENLQFGPENCSEIVHIDDHDGEVYGMWIPLAKANRLLRERLEKAPLVQGWPPTEKQYGTWVCDDVPNEKFALDRATHTARLVCFKEIKK